MPALLFALFGLAAGSFLNVVILRFGERGSASWRSGRSECPHCHTTLRWYDLVPVLSWLSLGGRCRRCGARISLQYPLVEASTAVLFAGIGASGLPAPSIALALPIASLLLCIFVYDLRHTLIPDAWAWPFVALAFVYATFSFYLLPAPFYSLLFSGPVAALPILFLWYLSAPFAGAPGRWMGFGDVKLALGMGWLLGFPLGFVAVFLAFIIGALVSVLILLPLPLYRRLCGIPGAKAAESYTMKSEVPFGPFLVAACFIVWFSILYQVPIPPFFGV